MAAASLLALTACSAPAASPTPAAKATQAPAAAASSPAAAASSPAAAASPASAAASPAASSSAGTNVQKVNANTASIPEIQQALEANGVTNAARWAREVDEYRPYPTNDPSFGKLRGELAKYNPAPDVLEKIVASLTL
jgi:hypothetical protein